jgi:DNA-binding transcriptional LysR family regulator
VEEIRHLRSFITLAEERHFGRAAAILHVAQPALSQQLQRLEHEVGVTLLERSTRRVELTEAGRLLLGRARQIVADMDRTAGDLEALAAGRAGTVRLGFVGTATYDVLPQVARRVLASLPDVRLELHGEQLGPALLDSLTSEDLDLVVMRGGLEARGGVVTRELRTEPLVAVLPAHHDLAGRSEVRLADLAQETVITYPSGNRSSMHQRVLAAYRRAGVEPEALELLEVGETGTLVVFVAAGLGIGLVPASVRALRLDGVAYVPLAGEPETVSLVLAHRDNLGAAGARVADLVQDVATRRA